jgi:hypothetical protein
MAFSVDAWGQPPTPPQTNWAVLRAQYAILIAVSGQAAFDPNPHGTYILGVNDSGDLTMTPATKSPIFPILNDLSGNSWQLGSSLSGGITNQPTTNGGYPLSTTLRSPSGFLYNLFVLTSGMLQTVRIPVLQMRDAIVY